MGLTLYQLQECPYCMRVRIVLDEKGLDYDTIAVDLKNKPPELFERNPRGKVPVLVDGDLILYESHIINEYLDERCPAPRLMPDDPVARARVRLLADICDSELAPPLYRLARQTVMREAKAPVDEAAKSRAIDEAAATLERLGETLADQDFLVGRFSLADVAFAPWVVRLDTLGFPADRAPDSVSRWAARLADRPSIGRHTRRGR